jgi:hypothetical protein
MYIFVCDIDGTLCNSTERMNNITKKYNATAKWNNKCIKDFLDPEEIKKDKVLPGVENIFDLIKKFKAKLIFLTGRNERARKDTRKWLTENLNISNRVPLIMRKYNDFNIPVKCKEKLFKKHILNKFENAIFIFFEDEIENIEMYSKYGLVLKAPEVWDFLRELKND